MNKSLLRVTKRHPLLQFLYSSQRSKTFSSLKNYTLFLRNSSKEGCLNHCRVLAQAISLSRFHSTVANEEQIKSKNTHSAINVPTLQFEDIAFEQPVTYSDLCDSLQTCDTVDEQMLTLASKLALSPGDIENRMHFCKIIESFLEPFFGKIRIQMFGSTVNSLGFKGCDIDMSFETFTEEKNMISYLENPDVPLVSEVTSGKVTPSEICLLPRKEQLIFIHSLFLEFYKESEDPTIFINAHVPLVRFYHDKYGLKCDLTCCNKVAFANTKLLYLMGKLDERVIPLMMTIRYWAKHVELIGKGLLFNSYTISLMTLHFLQTRNPPVLPSTEYILSISDSLNVDDMTDDSFLEILRQIPPSENNQTLCELLKDFFFYYSYFDFTRVISPLIGGSVPREVFFSTAHKKFRMNSICVQDPMLLSHNCAELVDYVTCMKFRKELMVACWLLQNESNLVVSESKWGILNLFDNRDEVKNNIYQKHLLVTVPHTTKQILKDTALDDINLFTAETLMYLLKYVLLFECKPLEKSEAVELFKRHDEEMVRQKKDSEKKFEFYNKTSGNINKSKTLLIQDEKLKKFSDALILEKFEKFSSENKLILCFECKAVKNTWLGRDHVSLDSLDDDTYNDLVERERYISVNAASQNELVAKASKKKADSFIFLCECYALNDSPESLFLIFRPFQKTDFNPIIGIFLGKYLPELMKSVNETC